MWLSRIHSNRRVTKFKHDVARSSALGLGFSPVNSHGAVKTNVTGSTSSNGDRWPNPMPLATSSTAIVKTIFCIADPQSFFFRLYPLKYYVNGFLNYREHDS